MEDFLFENISKNFKENHYLTKEEFLAIVVWKRKPSAKKIVDSMNETSISVDALTKSIFNASTPEEKLKILLSVKQIGIAIASAILTVCYPNDFTVVDYRALNSLKKLDISCSKRPTEQIEDYLEYVNVCKKESGERGFLLRDFDRMLWAMDFYEGENGLKYLVDRLH